MQLTTLSRREIEDRSAFIGKVYSLLGFSLLLCAGGAFVGLSMVTPGMYWPLVIAEFVVLIACFFLQTSFPINVFLLSIFGLLTGLTLAPTLNYYVSIGAGGAIPAAAGSAAITFGALSGYVHWSKKDFSFLGGFLFMGLIGLVVTNLLGMFLHLPINQTIMATFGVLLFSGYILFDTSNLIHRYREDQYVAATLALYLDVLNLFLMLLQLFGGGRRR